MKSLIDARTLRTAAALGIDGGAGASAHAQRGAALAAVAARLNAELGAGGVALVTGPSGAGKSTLLRHLARAEGAVAVRRLTVRQARARVASLSARTPLARWLGLLSRFGLAEARVLVSRAGDLSAGERARLELALGAARCERSAGPRRTLVVDEWCSVLDRPTAAGVAVGAARWARERGVRLIGATAHDDLAAVIVADMAVRLECRGGAGAKGGVGWTACGLSRAG